ncbi:hypothetical protein [Vibrio hepatarius]|nr:hypothetical protein [Vibrio hepatarius]
MKNLLVFVLFLWGDRLALVLAINDNHLGFGQKPFRKDERLANNG